MSSLHNCSQCETTFTTYRELSRHMASCEKRIRRPTKSNRTTEVLDERYVNRLIQQKKDYEDQLTQLRNEYHTNLQVQRRDYETKLNEYKYQSGLAEAEARFLREQLSRTDKHQTQLLRLSDSRPRKQKKSTSQSLDLSEDRINDAVTAYTWEQYEQGPDGVAEWVVNQLLTVDGEVIYTCTNKTTKRFVFLNDEGNREVDEQAKKLIHAIKEPLVGRMGVFFLENEDKERDSKPEAKRKQKLYQSNTDFGTPFLKALVSRLRS